MLTGLALTFDLDLSVERTPIGIHFLFSRLLAFTTLIGMVASAATLVGMSLAQTAGRRRDVAVMKALGSVGEVNSFFLGETFLTAGVGVISGTALGVIIYVVLGIVAGPLFGPWPSPSLWSVVIIAMVSFFLAFLSSFVPLWWMIGRLSVVSALSGQTWNRGLRTGALVRRCGLAMKYALRDASTRRSETLATLLLVTLSFTLLSIILLGGHTALYTARSYIQRGVGEHVYVTATPAMAEAYVARLSFTGHTRSQDYLESSNQIPTTFLNWLQERGDMIVIDTRLVADTTAVEVALMEPLPGPSYRIVGDERSKDVLVVGVQPDNVVGDWVTWGRRLSKGDTAQAVIGDDLLDMFSDWSLERVSLWGKAFSIVGVVVDPLNIGKTVYVPYDILGTILGVEGPNIVLIKPRDQLQTIPDIVEKEATKYGLVIVELDEATNMNMLSLDRLWASVSWIASLSLVATTVGLASYLVAAAHSREDDLKVVVAIGSPWRWIVRILWVESGLVILPAAVLGVALGAVFSFLFIVLSPTIPSTHTLVIDGGVIMASLGLMSLASVGAASACLRRGRRQ